ncbi:MAG: HD-GYP domain-containing protein [Candidatus Alkaliphilus sp. MAG34]
MRIISTGKIRPGMIVGKNIYSADGRILLKKDVIITEGYLAQLDRLDIPYIYVKDHIDEDIVIDDVIKEESRVEAVNITRRAIEKIHRGRDIDVPEVKTVINKIVDELLGNSNLVLNLIDIRAQGDYLYGHSVNVAVLSGIIGVALNYNQIMLRDLMLGALFHDIGKTKLNRKIVEGKNSADSSGTAENKKHCQYGFDILRANAGISLYSAHVAYQHHEYFNGNGYPRGLKGQEISEFARIVSVANTYDIFLSNVREEEETSILKAAEYLTANCGAIFDPEIVAVFLKRVAIYPIGTRVLLNTGEKGFVTKTHKNFPTQPVVCVDTNLFDVKFNQDYDVDLSNKKAYFIIGCEENI